MTFLGSSGWYFLAHIAGCIALCTSTTLRPTPIASKLSLSAFVTLYSTEWLSNTTLGSQGGNRDVLEIYIYIYQVVGILTAEPGSCLERCWSPVISEVDDT